jgi:fructokinase
MSAELRNPNALPDLILAAPAKGRRKLVALAGPPASGKSTLAEELATSLCAKGHPTTVVPMDGFHLDNRVLQKMGLLARKGAPESFDALGLQRQLPALRSDETVYFPKFDRALDMSIGGAGHVTKDCEVVVVEGNYLLFDAPVWRELAGFWDFSVRLDVPMDVLENRLRERWRFYDVPEEVAEQKIMANDLPNARRVAENPLPADVVLSSYE